MKFISIERETCKSSTIINLDNIDQLSLRSKSEIGSQKSEIFSDYRVCQDFLFLDVEIGIATSATDITTSDFLKNSNRNSIINIPLFS